MSNLNKLFLIKEILFVLIYLGTGSLIYYNFKILNEQFLELNNNLTLINNQIISINNTIANLNFKESSNIIFEPNINTFNNPINKNVNTTDIILQDYFMGINSIIEYIPYILGGIVVVCTIYYSYQYIYELELYFSNIINNNYLSLIDTRTINNNFNNIFNYFIKNTLAQDAKFLEEASNLFIALGLHDPIAISSSLNNIVLDSSNTVIPSNTNSTTNILTPTINNPSNSSSPSLDIIITTTSDIPLTINQDIPLTINQDLNIISNNMINQPLITTTESQTFVQNFIDGLFLKSIYIYLKIYLISKKFNK